MLNYTSMYWMVIAGLALCMMYRAIDVFFILLRIWSVFKLERRLNIRSDCHRGRDRAVDDLCQDEEAGVVDDTEEPEDMV